MTMTVHTQTPPPVHRKRRYPCSMCSYSAGGSRALVQHERHVHGTKFIFTCKICHLKMGTPIGYTKHLKGKHDDVTCGKCMLYFDSPGMGKFITIYLV